MLGRKVFVYADTENLSVTAWRDCIPQLEMGDSIFIPVTSNSGGALNLTDISLMYKKGINYTFADVQAGTKNAMDFVIVAQLSRDATLYPNCYHIILSGDNGYAPLIKFIPNSHICLCESWDSFSKTDFLGLR